LPSLGHGLSRIDAALDTLGKRMERGTLPDAAEALVTAAKCFKEAAACTVLCGWRDKTWEIIARRPLASVTAPTDEATRLPASLLLACTAFHLPSLRPAMRRELHDMRYDRLARVLPRVWWVTPDALPPSSVIAGLGINAWAELPAVMAKGRRFAQVTVTADGQEVERAEVISELRPGAEGEITLLQELPSPQPFDGWVQASYEIKDTGRWALHTAQQWHPEEQRWGELEAA
jgi:hypothetical protein